MMLAAIALAFSVEEQAAVAQSSPSPAASATPVPAHARATYSNPFTVRGYVRAYDFTRQNASGFPSTASQLNQQSANLGASLHLDYQVLNTGLSFGGSYIYANPLNGCANSHSASFNCATLSGNAALANPLHLNPDNSVPGYGLSTFYEAYVQYKKNGYFAKVGDQVINTPWANASDSRLKPNAFQGADIVYQFSPRFSLEVMDMDRFQSRTTNDFLSQTLLTGAASELPYSTVSAKYNTGGFQYGRLGFTSGNVSSNLHYYHFDDLAYLGWLDGRYTFTHEKLRPFLAIQAGTEKNVGSSLVGKINSQVYGAQLGVNVTKNVVFTAGADVIPRHVENLPAGFKCNASTGQITPSQAIPAPGAGYFVGSNAPQCIANPNGTYSVEYGGIASPYTDSYATDPLFTTSLTQGMVDRRAPGSSEKLALTYTSNDKRLVLAVSRAYYDYGFANFPQQTTETDGDAMYYLRALGKGPYHGLLLRYRYGVRTYDHTALADAGIPAGTPLAGAYFGGLPYFVYNRAQLEYDF